MTLSTSHRNTPPTPDKQGGHCFGCGPANAQGLHLEFSIDAVAHTATATVNLTRFHEGPSGHIHGGIIATLMDEAMSKLNKPLGVIAVTHNLEVTYLRPSPLGQPLVLTARHVRHVGRKLFHEAQLQLPDGTLLAQATGIFVALRDREG